MTGRSAPWRAALIAAFCITLPAPGAATRAATQGSSEQAVAPRIEARSADLVAVGLVHGERMTLRLTRVIDNSPVTDAAVTAVLRGVTHPAIAEVDGSYTIEAKDLALPGTAAIEFQVAQGANRQTLKGTLQVAAGEAAADDKNNARQLWWWVLNFSVCIGFLWLISRRRKSAQT